MSTRRGRISLVVASLALIVALGANMATYSLIQQQKERSRENHTALCAFRDDLVKRADSTRTYLAEHPDPVIFGIPRSVFINQLKNQDDTIASLSSLNC